MLINVSCIGRITKSEFSVQLDNPNPAEDHFDPTHDQSRWPRPDVTVVCQTPGH